MLTMLFCENKDSYFCISWTLESDDSIVKTWCVQNITWQLEKGIVHFALNLPGALWHTALPQPFIHGLSCDDVVSCIRWSFPLHHDCGRYRADEAKEGQREAQKLYPCIGHRLRSENVKKWNKFQEIEKIPMLSWCSSCPGCMGWWKWSQTVVSTLASSGNTTEEREALGMHHLRSGGAGGHLVEVRLSATLKLLPNLKSPGKMHST